jgi:hypothetical protein
VARDPAAGMDVERAFPLRGKVFLQKTTHRRAIRDGIMA